MGLSAPKERINKTRRRSMKWLAFASVLIVLPAISTMAASIPTVNEINNPGFGDYQNSFSWSMAWFKGSLYIGTARDEQCVEFATAAHYDVEPYSTNPSPGVVCPPNPFDMNLRAEIWRFTPSSTTSGQWTRVYQSPVIQNPEDPSKQLAVDIGYRGMVVYTSPTGEQALYVGAINAGSFIPEVNTIAPPRILRTTDGVNFTPLNGAPDRIYTSFDPVNGEKPIGYRAMTVFDGRMFVTVTSGYRGDGVVVEVGQPWSDNPTFTQISPKGTQIFDMAVFNNELYIGAGDETNGYSVLRTDATGQAPYAFTTVVSNGAGRGPEITSVVSMFAFQGRLYVGASGWYNAVFPASELIRIAPDDSWEVVVGKARNTTEGYLKPISGLPDGFGNVFNAHFWRMQDINGGLYLGTNDWSWKLQNNPSLRTLLSWQFGFDLYGTCNGQSWFVATQDAFGDGQYNFGARVMSAMDPYGGFIGSANQAAGTSVYSTLGTIGLPYCSRFTVSSYWSDPFSSVSRSSNGTFNRTFRPAITSAGSFDPSSAASWPTLLQADTQANNTVLSWNPSQGAKQYRVYRAVYMPNAQVGVPSPKKLPMPFAGDLPADVIGPFTGAPATGVSILGAFVSVGTTTNPFFVDTTAKAGTTYAYKVRAESGPTQVSADSNIVVSPGDSAISTFDSVNGTISTLAAKGQITQSTVASLTTNLNSAKAQNDQGQIQAALKTLGALIQQVMPGAGAIQDDVYAEELATQLSSLQRSIALANIAQSRTTTPPGDTGVPGSTPTPPGGVSPWSSFTYPSFQSGFSFFAGPR